MTTQAFNGSTRDFARSVVLTCAAAVLALALACAAQRKAEPAGGGNGAPAAGASEAAPATPAPDLSLVTGHGTVIFQTTRGEVAIKSEIVDTPPGRTQGLMYRRTLAPDAGMVFIFPNEEVQSFWMRNTFVSLDIIFVNARMDVVGVAENAEPQTLTPRTVGKLSKYVVEVVAGLTRANGIRAGTKVRFENVPLSAAQ